MKMSHIGIELLKRFEGLELEAYQDIAGVWTIGYGHTGNDVKPGMRITESQAENLLRRDLKSRENAVDRFTSVPLNQNEFDALVSFVYNVGIEGYKRSTALRRLNKKDKLGAADALTWWNKATVGGVLRAVTGLTRRRAAERSLFLTPVTPIAVTDPNDIGENSRITPVEEPPRRGSLGDSRAIKGATVAGGAGVAASNMGKNDAEELDTMETRIENGDELILDGKPSPGDTVNEINAGAREDKMDDTNRTGTSDDDIEVTSENTANDTQTETIEVGREFPSKHEKHAVDAQIQFALMILIILAVFFIIFARIDDWLNYRR